MRKSFLFIIITAFFLLFPLVSFAQVNDIKTDQVNVNAVSDVSVESSTTTTITGEHIKDFGADYTINKDGTIDVVETIVYDFAQPATAKHGIYRNLKYITTNSQGKKFKMDFRDFRVTDENNTNYNFSRSDNGEEISLKIGSANITVSGVKTYKISYKISGGLTYFSEHDEFYWNVNGFGWTVPVAKIHASITLPEKVAAEKLKLICYTGSYGSKEQNCKTNISSESSAVFATNTALGSGQNMSIALSFPMNIAAVLEPKEVVNWWDTFWGRIISIIIGILIFIWYVGLPIAVPMYWWLRGRDPKPEGGIGETRAWYDPPKNKKGRLLTPAETGTLVDEKVDIKDICAMIVDLARRGYFKIVEKKGGVLTDKSFELVKIKEADSQLQPYEADFLKDIFSGKDIFQVKDNKMYSTVEKAKSSLYQSLVDDGFFPSNPQTIRTIFYVLAGLAMVTINFHLAIILFVFAGVMPRKTALGAAQANVGKSLKNFLTSQERQLEFQAKNQMMFEKLLPFAIAFGVEKVWAERFKDMNLKSPDWYQGQSTANFNSVIFANSLNRSFSSIRSSATPVSSTTGHSSGFSGGFSGGGGGGGGGGSW